MHGSACHIRDRCALIAPGRVLLATIVGEVAFPTGGGNDATWACATRVPLISDGLYAVTSYYCASHKNWTSVHQLPLQNHCFIGSGGG